MIIFSVYGILLLLRMRKSMSGSDRFQGERIISPSVCDNNRLIGSCFRQRYVCSLLFCCENYRGHSGTLYLCFILINISEKSNPSMSIKFVIVDLIVIVIPSQRHI